MTWASQCCNIGKEMQAISPNAIQVALTFAQNGSQMDSKGDREKACSVSANVLRQLQHVFFSRVCEKFAAGA